METPIFSTLRAVPCRSRSSSRSTLLLAGLTSNQEYALHPYLHKARIPPPISMKSNRMEGPRLSAAAAFNQPFLNDVWRDSRCVEVIGIGSRVDSVFDVCLSLCSSLGSLRFWNAIPGPSLLLKGQLQVRLLEKDVIPASLVAPQELQSLFKAFVLVASAGYGDEHITVTDILKTAKSACGLVVVIVLSPFSFEGLRRQDEVRILQEKLQGCVNFFIEIDIDALLETDSVTLDEAFQTTNRAIFFALNAVSILISDFHPKYKYSQDGIVEELTVNELITVLEGYTRGQVGFGFGSTFESSIAQAVHDCPFFSAGLKEPNGIIICIFSGAKVVDSVEVNYLEHAFRTVTGCTQDIIISRVLDPDVAVNTVATTILALGSLKKTSKNKSNIISRLVERAPFLFRFLRILHSKSDNPKKCCSTDISSLHYGGENRDKKVSDVEYAEEGTDCVKLPCSERKMLPIGERDNMHSVREHDNHSLCGFGQQHEGSTSGVCDKLKVGSQETEVSQVKPSNSWNLEFEKNLCGNFIDKGELISEDFPNYPSIHDLPVGVKTSEPLSSNVTVSKMDSQQILKDDSSFEVLGKTSLYFRNTSLTPSREKTAGASEKLGVLSVRAASMLEAERDSKSRLSPIMEIDYRGGIYKGHCQGGLPEGRGRLKFPDGSSYDGMWRYGKRSGLGRFCFHNGDVFQGSWRDDLMHGKGWFYFHNGDRWFANFWKGKANGEGRFYSKHGGVFFGYFQNGWRHGRFLCISENGSRYVEIWKEGVLESSEALDHDVSGSSYDYCCI